MRYDSGDITHKQVRVVIFEGLGPVLLIPMLKSMVVTTYFKPGIWLAGSTAASQSEAMLKNPC